MRMKVHKNFATSVVAKLTIALLSGGLMVNPLQAGEVSPGTILTKDNIDALKKQDFDGHKVADLLTDKIEMMVRQYDLKIKLTPNSKITLNPAWNDKNVEFGGSAKFDPSSKMITDYNGGVPFHDVKQTDPDAGWKLAWNHYYSNPVIGDTWAANAHVYITDPKKGIVDDFSAANARMRNKGRVNGAPATGNPNDHSRYMLVITNPYDVAGLGIFNKQYDDGKVDDGWVYLKSIRRTRRTAGGKSWMDPQPKMDLLNDDNQGSLGMPAWFKNWQVLEKRWILAVVDAPDPNEPFKLEDMLEMSPPYWNVNTNTQAWSPREVWVVKGTMPEEHPYGHKVLYMDVEFPTYYMSEIYDKKGDFWRLWRQSYAQTDESGVPQLYFINTQTIDFQRQRSTYISIEYMANGVVSEKFFKPSALKLAAAGKLASEFTH